MSINQSNQLIGLSLSLCISDILREEVKLDNIIKIYTSCLWKSEEELEKLLKHYHKFYWYKSDFTRVKNLINQLLPKIQRTRLLDPPCCPDISKGHWVTDESDISWHR